MSPSKKEKEQRQAFCDWLFDFEYSRLGVPAPEKVLFLDVHPAVSQKLIYSRYHGDESKKDIHEKNYRYLLSCRESAVWACEHLGWTVVRCSDEEQMRTREDIAEEIFTVVMTD